MHLLKLAPSLFDFNEKKPIQVYFEFFLVKVVVDCFVLHFFSCKNKVCYICNNI